MAIRFSKFEGQVGDVWINPAHVSYFFPHDENWTTIVLDNDKTLMVKAPVAQVQGDLYRSE